MIATRQHPLELRPPVEPILLYDGACGFCNGLVQFVLARDRRGTLRFAALQGEFARQLSARYPVIAGADTAAYVETGDGIERVFIRSDAILRVLGNLGLPWSAFAAARVVPRQIRDWAYAAFARRRYRWFGRYLSCPVPAANVRTRFLD
jgi:predicted DCC family thiol-disulfide oxidoreductase YuxK